MFETGTHAAAPWQSMRFCSFEWMRCAVWRAAFASAQAPFGATSDQPVWASPALAEGVSGLGLAEAPVGWDSSSFLSALLLSFSSFFFFFASSF